MRRRNGLHALQRLAEFGADAASRDVGLRLAQLRAEEERLRQIEAYGQQYEQLSVSVAPGLTLAALTGRRKFAARLRAAAEGQRQLVAEHEEQYRQQLERWRGARTQALALQRYNERLRERAHDARERREQRALDEVAQRRR